jgi:exonuclease VII small subunit
MAKKLVYVELGEFLYHMCQKYLKNAKSSKNKKLVYVELGEFLYHVCQKYLKNAKSSKKYFIFL